MGSKLRRRIALALACAFVCSLPYVGLQAAAEVRDAPILHVDSAVAGTTANVKGSLISKYGVCLPSRLIKVYIVGRSTAVAQSRTDGAGKWKASVRLTGGERIYAKVAYIGYPAKGTRPKTHCMPKTSPTVTAKWPTSYQLTVTKGGLGDGTWTCNNSACAQRYPRNATVTIAAVPDDQSIFAGWSGAGCSGTGSCVVQMTSDVAVKAFFVRRQYQLTFDTTIGDGSGTVTCDPGPCDRQYAAGTLVAATAVPDEGSAFGRWDNEGLPCSRDTGPTCTFEVKGNYVIRLRFDAPHDTRWQPTSSFVPAHGTFFALQPEPRDRLVEEDYSYSLAEAEILVDAGGRSIEVNLRGDERWRAWFVVPDSSDGLEEGVYEDVRSYHTPEPGHGGSFFSGGSYACQNDGGWFAIDDIGFEEGGGLDHLTLRFGQVCSAGGPVIFGKLRFDNDDVAVFPDPGPGPSWHPPISAVPASGNFAYIESQDGDHIGEGDVTTYTASNSRVAASTFDGNITFSVRGAHKYDAYFVLPERFDEVREGYVPDLHRHSPDHNVVKGGMNILGDDRYCNEIQGWFTIDDIGFDSVGVFDHITMRFEYGCAGWKTMKGMLRYDDDEGRLPPEDVPGPEWQPLVGHVPATGSYFYAESDPADRIGAGRIDTFTPDAEWWEIKQSGGLITANVGSPNPASFGVEFKLPNTYDRAEAGYFADAGNWPFDDRSKPGIRVSGQARGCDGYGWFAVDDIGYEQDGVTLDHITVRFEQHCYRFGQALRGKFRLVAPTP